MDRSKCDDKNKICKPKRCENFEILFIYFDVNVNNSIFGNIGWVLCNKLKHWNKT
jgi:hypothetical protein